MNALLLCLVLLGAPKYVYNDTPKPEVSRTSVWAKQDSGEKVVISVINDMLPSVQLYKTKDGVITHVILTYGEHSTPLKSVRLKENVVNYATPQTCSEPVPVAVKKDSPWDYMKKPSEVRD